MSEMPRGKGMLAAAVFLVGAVVAPGFAQSPDRVPDRVGNIWDHQSHQPTQADVGTARRPGTVDSVKPTEVQKDVDDLLRQTDEINSRLDQLEKGSAGGSAAPRAGGSR